MFLTSRSNKIELKVYFWPHNELHFEMVFLISLTKCTHLLHFLKIMESVLTHCAPWDNKKSLSEQMLQIKFMSASRESVRMCVPQNNNSTLVLAMVWCLRATNHYLSLCCPRFISPHGDTRPQRVKLVFKMEVSVIYRRVLYVWLLSVAKYRLVGKHVISVSFWNPVFCPWSTAGPDAAPVVFSDYPGY